MANKAQNRFFSPTKGELSLQGVAQEISDFINEDSQALYGLVVGTDSQAKRLNGISEIDFVTAIVIHRRGRGGRYFWHKERQHRVYVLREKIYTETLMSLELAHNLVPCLREKIPGSKYDLEIHIDVGPVGPTRDMIKEVVGMVAGNGYTAKTKPESYGASTVADKHT
ncbi:MAG: ribonuclease H-like YkuK family protein [bacterium]|nr:ribonuclease H-like YkuK family protein [bacterium]